MTVRAVVFAYHDVGVRCLSVLLAHGLSIPLVVTHRDDPAERVWFGSVARLAADHDLAVETPADPNAVAFVEKLRALAPDFLFSFYYRHMLAPEVLATARRGGYNVHGSLLPKYRGRAPVNWAVLEGERETGATLHRMAAKPDAGEIVDQLAVPILRDDLAIDVFRKVTAAAEIVLHRSLPALLEGTAPHVAQDPATASYFGGRRPEDGRIDGSQPATAIHNLVRAVAPPYPGAFTDLAGHRVAIHRTRVLSERRDAGPAQLRFHGGEALLDCSDGGQLLILEMALDGHPVDAETLRQRLGEGPHDLPRTPYPVPRTSYPVPRTPYPVPHTPFVPRTPYPVPHTPHALKKLCILGVNGFIGHHLSQRVLANTGWEVFGMDMADDRVVELRESPRFHFFEGDITINREWIEYHIRKCDVVLPLVAIATPAMYVREPLRVFELDFEANLPIVRSCVKHGKRILFPSTSEVYGMCRDAQFDPYASELVLGPIDKQRWIYACAKQLMDRVIWAYGSSGELDFTLFRPFNWIGSGLDSIHTPKEGSSRVVTQFLGHIVRGEAIKLVDGGGQKRTFTYIDDGLDALMKIIENRGGVASGRIYNIGNPRNNYSVRELAHMMVELARSYPEYRDAASRVELVEVTSDEYYGAGYQDVQHRVPAIDNTMKELDWQPKVDMATALARIFDAYRGQLEQARALAG